MVQDSQSECNRDQVQIILEQYKDVFPEELPAELRPERSVYHTIPLKDNNAVPPARKSYRLSQPELRNARSKFLRFWQRVIYNLAAAHMGL